MASHRPRKRFPKLRRVKTHRHCQRSSIYSYKLPHYLQHHRGKRVLRDVWSLKLHDCWVSFPLKDRHCLATVLSRRLWVTWVCCHSAGCLCINILCILCIYTAHTSEMSHLSTDCLFYIPEPLLTIWSSIQFAHNCILHIRISVFIYSSMFMHFSLSLHAIAYIYLLCSAYSCSIYVCMLKHRLWVCGRSEGSVQIGKRARWSLEGLGGICVLCYVVVWDPWNTSEDCQNRCGLLCYAGHSVWIPVARWKLLTLLGQVMACRDIEEWDWRCSGKHNSFHWLNRKHLCFLWATRLCCSPL